MLQSMGWQRVGHNRATELTELSGNEIHSKREQTCLNILGCLLTLVFLLVILWCESKKNLY